MSDALVRAHLEQLAGWLSDPAWLPEGSALMAWNDGFTAAVRNAERGPGWGSLVAQAHSLNEGLQGRAAALEADMADIRRELQNQGPAHQALKAYHPFPG